MQLFLLRNCMAASVDTVKCMRLDPQAVAALDEVAVLDVEVDVDEAEEAVAAGDAGVVPNTIMAWIFPTLTAVLPMPSSVNWDVKDVKWSMTVGAKVTVMAIIVMVAMVITSTNRTMIVRSSS
jgi:hypothetical protein